MKTWFLLKTVNFLDRLERKVIGSIIPVESFGYVLNRTYETSPGFVQNEFRWLTSEKERENFYKHNREADRLASVFRSWSFKLKKLM